MVAIPPDRLKALMSPGDDAGATGAATAPEAPSGPLAAPMSTPEPKMGDKEGALVNLAMALDLIQQAIPALGSDSEQGKKATAAAQALNGLLGPSKPKTDELQSAEIMQLLGSLPQAGNVTPEVQAILGQKNHGNKAAMPPLPTGAGAPPPPGAQPQPQPQAA